MRFLPRLLSLPLLASILLPGCASDRSFSPKARAGTKSVAVDHAPRYGDGRRTQSRSGAIATRVIGRGASIALGVAGLGLVASVARDVIDISGIASGSDGELSEPFVRFLIESKAEPAGMVAARFESRLRTRSGFRVSHSAPQAVFHFRIAEAYLKPVDEYKLRYRPVIKATGSLIGGDGKVLWRKTADGSRSRDRPAGRTWREYASGSSGRIRADVGLIADGIAEELFADLQK
jgi:hypothetical protein